jgi:hypothetical protein
VRLVDAKAMKVSRRVPLLLAVAVSLPGLAHARRPLTLKVPAYDVEPLSDREVCTFVPVPAGVPFDIGSWEVKNAGADARSTSHHFIIYAYLGDDLEAMKQAYAGKSVDDTACLNMAPDPTKLRFLGGAQTPRYRQIMPAGLALRVESSGSIDGKKVIGFVLNSHWINGSSSKVRGRPSVKFVPARTKKVKKFLQPIFEVVANANLKVPPGATATTGFQWAPGASSPGRFLGGIENPAGPACVTMITGHMHRRGTLFEANYHGASPAQNPIYRTTEYNHPGQTDFREPLLVQLGESISYRCTQDNQTDPRMGCEEQAGITPGRSIVEAITAGGFDDFTAPAHKCDTDADCAGIGTGRCVPANLVFGFHEYDDMCIMPGYYYDADPVHGCNLSAP